MSRIPEEMLSELVRLQSLASRTSKGHPAGHEYRQAGDLLAVLAIDAMNEYGVNVTSLSLQMGKSPHTMRNFLMRRGAIPETPSHARTWKPYGSVEKSTLCKRGHDRSAPGAVNAYNQCMACNNARYHESKARKKAA